MDELTNIENNNYNYTQYILEKQLHLQEALIEYCERIKTTTTIVEECTLQAIHNWECYQSKKKWLDIDAFDNDKITIIPYIPIGVRRLSINCIAKLLEYIPESVKELYYCEDNYCFPILPKGLRKLSCHVNNIKLPDEFPQNLHTLEISSSIIGASPHLPNSLRNLIIKYNSIEPPNLPIGLKYLKYYMTRCYIPQQGLPSNLVRFECNETNIEKLPDILPRTLKVLCCGENRLSSLPPLPEGLQVLICSYNKIEQLPLLPSTLKVLHCGSNHLTYLPPLPKGIMRLICTDNYITNLPPLPISLKELIN